MKKNKRFYFLSFIFLFALLLGACNGGGPSSSGDDFTIDFGGLSDRKLKVRESVNVLGLITVYGSDGLNYLKDTVAESDCTLTGNNNILTSDEPKTCTVTYTTTVNGKEYKATKKFIFEPYPLTSITVNGITVKYVLQGSTFNVLDGVSAIGSDEIDYTSRLNVTSSNCTVSDNILDTTETKVCTLTYSIDVEDIKQEYKRHIVITDEELVNHFGNDLTDPSTIVFGGEDELLDQDPAHNMRIWYVDGDWAGCGPRVTVKYNLSQGGLTVISENLNGNTNNWNTQLYYKTDKISQAGTYILEFDVFAENERKIVFDRKTQSSGVSVASMIGVDANQQIVVPLKQGNNHVRVGYNVKANDVIMMKVLLGKTSPSDADNLGQLRFSNFSIYNASKMGLYDFEIRGLEDVTIKAKTEFDVTQGVSVIGNDFKTYNDALVVTCDNATITNNKLDTSKTGTYVLKYKAVKGDIESEVYERTITIIGEDEHINILTNGKFDTGIDPWICDGGPSSKFVCSVKDGKLTIDVNNSGATLDYHGQVIQTGLTNIKAFHAYKVIVKASSTTPRPLEVRVQEQGGGWNTVYSKVINLTPEMTEFEFDYEAISTYNQIQFGLLLGKFEKYDDIVGDHTVTIDEVVLTDLGPLPPEEHVPVGTTEFFGNDLTDPDTLVLISDGKTTRANDKINIWYNASAAWGLGTLVDGEFKIENGKFIADMKTLGDANWHVQFNYKTRLLRESGNYRLTFTVHSDVVKVIEVEDNAGKRNVTLQVGENNLELNFNGRANEPIHIYMALGKASGESATRAKLEFYNFSIKKV